jgi:hypothetical protein
LFLGFPFCPPIPRYSRMALWNVHGILRFFPCSHLLILWCSDTEHMYARWVARLI